MFVIGANPYAGLWTKSQFLRGKGFKVGTRASITDPNGQTKEFVAVKLAAATWINGIAVIIDGVASTGVGTAVATASGLPAAAINTRLGILTFGSATATQTMAGTAFGWAQIYGQALAWLSASISVAGMQLAIGASGDLIPAVVQVSASGQVVGISAITTISASTPTRTLGSVMLTYPHFSGLPDANLA